MVTFNALNAQYPWALPTVFAVILLVGLFLRRRSLAARVTRAAQGEGWRPGARLDGPGGLGPPLPAVVFARS